MNLDKVMGRNFIEYASYVIKDRAIPHLDDGFKPVQRRILHSLHRMDDGKFNKVANVVGHSMQFHPHGDASIYSALVNLANKEYFIERQGNFGNIYTGDEAAAARYIEARLTPLAKEVLFNKDLTEFIDSYDGRNKEPVTLPAKVPVLLMLGTEGIAVGLSTRILPHNFAELLRGQIAILNGTATEIYPDFIQGGEIDVSEYAGGQGKVKVRAAIEIAGHKSLIIRELPYGTTSESLITSIEDAAKKGKIKISAINDFTAENVEIEVVPARGISAEELKPALFAFTDCEVSISVSATLIFDEKPRQMTVGEILERNTLKLKADLTKELEIAFEHNNEKLHEMTLERIFIENRIYKDIEELKTYEAVQQAVLDGVNRFRDMLRRDPTVEDVERLLAIKIKRISRFDIDQHQKKIREIKAEIKRIRTDLKDMTSTAIRFIERLLEKYGKQLPRRTKIASFAQVDVKEVALENVKVRYDAEKGYIGSEVRDGEQINMTEFDKILLIGSDGVYKVINIPGKIFVGENMLYVGKFDKDIPFNLIYKNPASEKSFCKRFYIDKFILEKEYRLFSDGCCVQAFSTGEEFRVKVFYKRKPRLRIFSEEVDFAEQNFKGVASKGNTVGGGKEISRIRILEAQIEEPTEKTDDSGSTDRSAKDQSKIDEANFDEDNCVKFKQLSLLDEDKNNS